MAHSKPGLTIIQIKNVLINGKSFNSKNSILSGTWQILKKIFNRIQWAKSGKIVISTFWIVS
jgi:hypothetical protein